MSRITSILFSALIIFLLVIFFILPTYQEFQVLSFEAKEKRAELEFKEEYFNNLANLAQTLEQYKEEFSKIDSSIPQDPFLPSLFHFIARTASENGLVFKDIGKFTISAQKDRPDLKDISIDLTLNGTYSSLKNFLVVVEGSSRMIEVENIKFVLPKEGGDLFDFNLKLKAHSY